MKRTLCLGFLIAAIIGACHAGSEAAGREWPGSGAFVVRRADSVKALVSQIRAEKVVAARYARHFGMSPEAVANYFEENLQLVTLKKPLRATTYYVSRTSLTLSKERLFPAGSRVFATADGEPVLAWRCANPLLRRLPAAKSKPVQVTKTPTVKVEAVTPMEVVELVPPIAVLPTVEATPTPAMPTFVPQIEPTMESVAAPPVISPPGLPAIALVVPALLGAVSVHTSSTIPEPATAVALALAASTLLVRRLRWKSLRP